MKFNVLLKNLGFRDKAKDDLDTEMADKNTPTPAVHEAKRQNAWSESSTSFLKATVGSIGMIGDAYFPPEMVGGTCPRVVGEEEDIVWNAAAEACDSERLHVVWQAFGDRIWYLAVKSSDLSNHTNSWCPLSALLPTMKDAADLPACYTYYGGETAILMVVTGDGLQIMRGTNPVVRAKAERMAMELKSTNIIELTPTKLDSLSPIPWYSVSLFEDRARRILAAFSVIVSLSVGVIAFFIWLIASLALDATHHEIATTIAESEQKSLEVLQKAQEVRASPMRADIEKFINLNDDLISVNGFLYTYQIELGEARWKAKVPASLTAERILAMGGKNTGSENDATTIANEAQIKFELNKR